MTHRASAEYRAFRAAVQDEALLDRPSDLRFWRPTGIGFLAKQAVNFMQREACDQKASQYIITREMLAADGCREKLVALLEGVAARAEENERVQSFWILDRGQSEQGDASFYIFERYTFKDAAAEFAAELEQQSKTGYKDLCKNITCTTWIESRIGFISR